MKNVQVNGDECAGEVESNSKSMNFAKTLKKNMVVELLHQEKATLTKLIMDTYFGRLCTNITQAKYLALRLHQIHCHRRTIYDI